MIELSEYGEKYPFLVYDIWNFYCDKNIHSSYDASLKRHGINVDAFVVKCTTDFSNVFVKQYKDLKITNGVITESGYMIQPWVITRICDKLCEYRYLCKFEANGFRNFDMDFNFYYGYGVNNINKTVASRMFNSVVFGFKYIYNANKTNVLPIYVEKDGEPHTGSCFKTVHGIVTAKHCIEKCSKVEIAGIDKILLNNCKILTKENLDIVIIIPQNGYKWDDCLMLEMGSVLDNIMVMGYPQHSGFENFVTATVGTIAAVEESYLYKHELMLLTSKVKGGNSGGPVINNRGYVVGIVTEVPASEGGDYDQFGYGIAIPQKYIIEIFEHGEEYNLPVNFG